MKIPKCYKDKDANLSLLKNKKVGIIGYGSQGSAQALNLRDSGINVTIGLREGSSSWQLAEGEGLSAVSIEEAVRPAEIISILIPDQMMGKVYAEKIAPHLKEGQTLLFSHGYNIHYGLIQPLENINVIMAAPSGAGAELRKQYTSGSGIPGLFAVHQDFSGNAKELTLAYCKAIGLSRIGVFESSFKEETETDLFGEQIILTGGIPKLIQSSYKVLHEAGYSPVAAWLVCYYELKTIVDLFHSKGFEFMNRAISDTAEYGGITRGKRIINSDVEGEMRKVLQEIQSGEFHREWIAESEEGYPRLNELRKEESKLLIEEVGQRLLKELFPDK